MTQKKVFVIIGAIFEKLIPNSWKIHVSPKIQVRLESLPNVEGCVWGSKTANLRLFIFSSWNSLLKMSKNGPKIVIFQFWINRPIWPILMICKLDKVSLGIFTWFSRYWANRHIIRRKIGFLEVKYHFWAFSHKCKNRFFVEYSTGVEISTMKFSEKKTYVSCWHSQ